jgi:hypothetical protein
MMPSAVTCTDCARVMARPGDIRITSNANT